MFTEKSEKYEYFSVVKKSALSMHIFSEKKIYFKVSSAIVVISALTFTTLLFNSADDQLMIFFFLSFFFFL